MRFSISTLCIVGAALVAMSAATADAGRTSPRPSPSNSPRPRPSPSNSPRPSNSPIPSPSPSAAPKCTEPTLRVRKEIRDLTLDEWSRYIKAVKWLQSQPPRGIFNSGDISNLPRSTSRWNEFADVHFAVVRYAHRHPAFLPWHRHFLKVYEDELRRFDATVTVPYFDWSSAESYKSWNNPNDPNGVFTPTYFGTTGLRNGPTRAQLETATRASFVTPSTGCVTDSLFLNNATGIPQFCVKRLYETTEDVALTGNVFTESSLLANGISSNTGNYDGFRSWLESDPHAGPHVSIGESIQTSIVNRDGSTVSVEGDMFTMLSPKDVFFFSHHAFIDRVWDRFQRANPANARAYGGLRVNQLSEPTSTRITARESDALYPFSYVQGATQRVLVRDVFSSEDLCFVYADEVKVNGLGKTLAALQAAAIQASPEVANSTASLVAADIAAAAVAQSFLTTADASNGARVTFDPIVAPRTVPPARWFEMMGIDKEEFLKNRAQQQAFADEVNRRVADLVSKSTLDVDVSAKAPSSAAAATSAASALTVMAAAAMGAMML